MHVKVLLKAPLCRKELSRAHCLYPMSIRYKYINIFLYKMVKFNLYFYDLRAVWGHYQPPVILESNYTSELQGSFGIEIMPSKNYNRPGIIISPSECFLIAKLCFSQCYWRSSDNPSVFLSWELPWVQQSNMKNLWIFLQVSSTPSRTGNWILHNCSTYLVHNLGAKKIQWRFYIFLEILQHLPNFSSRLSVKYK